MRSNLLLGSSMRFSRPGFPSCFHWLILQHSRLYSKIQQNIISCICETLMSIIVQLGREGRVCVCGGGTRHCRCALNTNMHCIAWKCCLFLWKQNISAKFNGNGGQVSLTEAVLVYYKISPPTGTWHWTKVALKLNTLYSQQVHISKSL